MVLQRSKSVMRIWIKLCIFEIFIFKIKFHIMDMVGLKQNISRRRDSQRLGYKKNHF